jgi:hypothetical protein
MIETTGRRVAMPTARAAILKTTEGRGMTANAIALSVLLLGAGMVGSPTAQAAMTGDPYGAAHSLAQVASEQPVAAPIRVADGGKLGDKYMSGKSGGAKGIGSQKDKKGGK